MAQDRTKLSQAASTRTDVDAPISASGSRGARDAAGQAAVSRIANQEALPPNGERFVDVEGGTAFVRGFQDADELDLNDVCQSFYFGDCDLVSALIAMAKQRPEELKRHIKQLDAQHYEVTIYEPSPDGTKRERVVSVEAKFPQLKGGGNYYAMLGDQVDGQTELWPLLYEKAIILARGGYASFDSGRKLSLIKTWPWGKTVGSESPGPYFLDAMVSGQVRRVDVLATPLEAVLEAIEHALERRLPVTVGASPQTDKAKATALSLNIADASHALAVLAVDRKSSQLVLRDPHGHDTELPFSLVREIVVDVLIGEEAEPSR